jgi:energy-coupling factor transport system permease protein
MEHWQVKKPLYPLSCLVASLIILFGGLILSKEPLFAVYLAALCLLHLPFGYGRVLARVLPLMLLLGALTGSLTGLINTSFLNGLLTTGRIMLLGLSALTLLALPPIQLTRCLTQLHVPRILTLGMLVTVRFVPVLLLESRRVLEAMRTRGVSAVAFRPAAFYRAFFIPLLMRIINIADILSLSLETRGFDLNEKKATVWRPVRFTMRDALFPVAVTVLTLAAFIVHRYFSGWLGSAI